MPLRICHVGRDIEKTGAGEVLRQLASEMAGRGHDVLIITDTPRSRLLSLPSAVRIRTTPLGPALLDWRPRTRLGWHVRHAVQIIVFTLAATAFARGLEARGWSVVNHNCEALAGSTVVMHNVFSAELRQRGLNRRQTVRALLNPTRAMRIAKEHRLAGARGARTFVVVASTMRGQVDDLLRGRHRVAVIPNAVDLRRFSVASDEARGSSRSELQLADTEIAVVFIGHEFKRKGLPELLHSMSKLDARFVLLVAGGASQNVPEYRGLARELGIADRVRFLGQVDDTCALLNAGDLFCLPSHYEGTPLAALEALATGTPVVLSDQCPVDELLVPDVNGLVCRVDAEDIADKLRSATSLLSLTADQIRETVLDRTWVRATDQYLDAITAGGR